MLINKQEGSLGQGPYEKLMAVIKKHSNQNSQNQDPLTPWFSTNELLEYIGISKQELMNHLNSLTEGIHYKVNNKDNSEPQILWRVDLIDDLLCLPIPPLEKEAMEKAINNHITCTS